MPAFWLWKASDPWPAAGEIDIVEHVQSLGDRVQGTIHVPSGYAGGGKHGRASASAVTDTFHTYAVDWNEKRIIWYCDGKEFFRVTNDGNRQNYPFFTAKPIIFNLAIGGGWPGPASPRDLPQNMVIDYVKVYAPNGSGVSLNDCTFKWGRNWY